MQTNLYYRKPYFTGTALSNLVGISVTQFNTLRNAGVLETKKRYTLQDVLYVAFTNSFKEMGHNWRTVLDFYEEAFGRSIFIQEINFLKYETIVFFVKDKKVLKACLVPKDNSSKEYFDCMELIDHLKRLESLFCKNKNNEQPKASSFAGTSGVVITMIHIPQVVEGILENSKELKLDIDIKKSLAIELEGEQLIG